MHKQLKDYNSCKMKYRICYLIFVNVYLVLIFILLKTNHQNQRKQNLFDIRFDSSTIKNQLDRKPEALKPLVLHEKVYQTKKFYKHSCKRITHLYLTTTVSAASPGNPANPSYCSSLAWWCRYRHCASTADWN